MKHPVSRLALIAAFTASVGLAADAAGQAVPRHGGGGGSSSGSSGGGSSSGSSSGSTASSGGSSSSGSSAGSDSGSAPQRHAVPRHGGGRSAGRGGDSGGSSGGSSGGGAVRRNPGGSSGRDDAGGSSVPEYARPGREGRPTVGYAVPRGSVRPPVRPGGDHNYYYLSPYRWYYDPFAFGTFGLGYIYDPFWWGPGYGYGPYAYGGGYGGYGGYGAGYGYGHSSSSSDDGLQGKLRIKAKPREAQVKVDGYFVGVVDDFDGAFQTLKLDDGPHKIELIADGYQPLAFDVLIVEGQTITYKGQLQKR